MTVRARRLGVLSVVLALAACTSTTAPNPPVPSVAPLTTAPSGSRDFAPGADTGGDPLFPAMGDGGYDVGHYGLTLTYDPASGTIDGDDVVTARATQALSRFDLDLHGLTVHSVTVGGRPATYTRQADKLVVTPPSGIVSGTQFVTDVKYGGVPTPYDDPVLGEEGFMERDGVIVQGEPQAAASWFAVDDTPRDKATYDVTVTTSTGLSVLSNGVLVGKTDSAAGTTWHWAESAPMASYLAMLMIGDYRVTTGSYHGLPMVLAVDSSLPASVDAVLAQTPQVLDFLVSQFGPYPFDAVGGVVHDDQAIRFALENQTRPVYAPGFFTVANDTSVLAHELAHQWYGDDVSVTSWSDIWLNEGFATYAQWLWTEHLGGQTPRQIFDDTYYGRQGQRLPTEPAAAPRTQAEVFGDSSAYVRGAATLEALRIAVGDDAFWRIVRGWPVYRHFGNATTADFVAYADQVSGRSLDAFLRPWLYGSGLPPYPKPLS